MAKERTNQIVDNLKNTEFEKIDEETLENITSQREITKATLLQDVVRPDIRKSIRITDKDNLMHPNIPLFTKETKIAYLTRFQASLIPETNDIINQSRNMGCEDFPIVLAVFKESQLNASSSVDGFLLKMINQNYDFKTVDIRESKPKRFFQRGGNDNEQR